VQQTTVNHVVATGHGDQGVACSAEDTARVVVEQPCDLAIVKSAHPEKIKPYESVTYTYVVTNTGPTTLTGIVVTDDNGRRSTGRTISRRGRFPRWPRASR